MSMPGQGVAAPRSPMIQIRGLRVVFGATQALAGVDLQIDRGELFALIGPDGAGKTTLFRVLAGLQRPSSGSVQVQGVRTFGLVPQRFSLYEDLSIDENLFLRARLYDIPDAVAGTRATELLERVGLARFRRRLAGALSGGMRQKLALVAALLTQPELLLLDEPTTGVDPVSRREFWTMLHRLHHEGLTILVSTPYMDEAEYATRIGFLHRGRLSALGTRAELLAGHTRALVEIRSSDRMAIRSRLAAVDEVDDVSLFGARLHARGRDGDARRLERAVEAALAGLVQPGDVEPVPPSLEDVFVLASETAAGAEP